MRQDAGVILLLVVCLVAFFAEPIFTAKVFSPAGLLYDYPPWNHHAPPGYARPNTGLMDRVNQHDRWRAFNRASWRAGEAPLWNPHAFAGVPHLANYQSAPLYPLALLTLPLAFEIAQLLLAMLHLGLAGFFTWRFLRGQGLAPAGAVLGALSFMFSGALVLWLGSPAGYVIAWFPALMYAAQRFAAAPRAATWLALWAVVVVQLLGGHPESSAYLLTTASIYFVFQLAGRWRRDGRRATLLTLGGWAAAWGLGALTAAAQIVPFLEYLPHTHLEGWLGDWGLGQLFPRPRLLAMATLVFPYVFGHPAWGDRELTGPLGLPLFNEIAGVYVGLLPLLLAVWAAVTRRHERDARFFSLFALATLAYFYMLPPVYAILKSLPFLNVSKLLVVPILSSFCLAYLAGRGLDDWLARVPLVAPARRRAIRGLVVAAVVIVLGVALAEAGLALMRDRLLARGEARIQALVSERAALGPSLGEWRAAGFWRARLPRTYDNARWAAATPLIAAGILTGAAVLLAAAARRRAVLLAGVVAITLGDLFFFGIRVNASTEARNVYPDTESIRFLQADRSQFRIAGINRVLTPNIAMAYGLSDARGLDAVMPGRYQRLLLADGRLLGTNLAEPLLSPHYNSRALDLAGVKYVLADARLPDARGLELVFDGDVFIYRNHRVLPRAWLVEEVRVAASPDDALRQVLAADFDPRRAAVVEADVRLEEPGVSAPARGDRRVQILGHAPRRVTVQVSTPTEGLLVLSDLHYPGWRAFVDGRERPIHPTNYAFRGVVVAAGEHRVEFAYDPWSFKLGVALSVAGLAGALVGAGVVHRRRAPTP